MTPEQFYYKTRKKAWGPFKAQTWDLPDGVRASIRATLRSKFEFLFRQLRVEGGRAAVERFVKPAPVRTPPPLSLMAP